jgi:hypothetical protein
MEWAGGEITDGFLPFPITLNLVSMLVEFSAAVAVFQGIWVVILKRFLGHGKPSFEIWGGIGGMNGADGYFTIKSSPGQVAS